MKPRLVKRIPLLLALTVIAAICGLRLLQPVRLETAERKTFDWRASLAARCPSPVATNLGFVFISDESIAALNDGLLGNRYGLYWPRHVYGRLVRELAAQGARAVAFDVLFAELRPDHAPVPVPVGANPDLIPFLERLHPGQRLTRIEDQVLVESDDFLAWQTHRAGNVIMAAEKGIPANDLFRTNALGMGDIAADKDPDGVLRRVEAFRNYRRWHPAFVQAAREYGLDLDTAQIETNRIILRQPGGGAVKVALDAEGRFALSDFTDKLPPGMPARAKPFTDERVWHMGIVLAAAELTLDLDHAEVDLPGHRIALRGPGGVERVIPVDADGFFPIDWQLTPADPRLTKEAIESLLLQDLQRTQGHAEGLTNRWRNRLVVVGSTATGNDLTDLGATPLENDTLLVSKHWNVANSILTNRFIRRTPLGVDLGLITLLGGLTAVLTWRLRAIVAAAAVILLGGGFCVLAAWLYVRWRLWLPMALPLLAAILAQHVILVSYRVVFEEKEKRRVRSFFAKVVSPNVVQELLRAEKLSFSGAHREVTVMFADVRGFTDLTDKNRETAEQHIAANHLAGEAATAYLNAQAQETLNTINEYLATVADVVKQHAGTLDKYIGDCVMAFWGAPTPNPRHAVTAVRAAIDAQRAIAELNRQRMEENQRRATAGQAPLPLLNLGSGLNTGGAIVGLMGSDAHILNYTVFGREVNVASRLESLSGRDRIVVGEATFQALQRDDPALAAQCLALPLANLKGIREAVRVYEVRWRPATETATPANGPAGH